MIDTEKDIIIGYVDDQNALTDGGDFVPRDDISLGDKKSAPTEREYPEADQETYRINTQRAAYIPGPLEVQVENYKDQIGSHREVSDYDACIARGINYKDFLFEQEASIKAMKDLDTFASGSIVKVHNTK